MIMNFLKLYHVQTLLLSNSNTNDGENKIAELTTGQSGVLFLVWLCSSGPMLYRKKQEGRRNTE